MRQTYSVRNKAGQEVRVFIPTKADDAEIENIATSAPVIAGVTWAVDADGARREVVIFE